MSDGAAAILLARRSKAEELGLPILGILRSYAVVGVPPDIMGIGPAYAIPVALQKAGKAALHALRCEARCGSHFCLSCCCQEGVVLWVLQSGWDRLAPLPQALPDPTAGTHTFIWNRQTQQAAYRPGMGWGPRRLSPAKGKGLPGQLKSSSPAGLTVDDVDIFEINEAFASQVSLFPNTAWALSSPVGARGAGDREESCR